MSKQINLNPKPKCEGETWAESSGYLSHIDIEFMDIMKRNGYNKDIRTKQDRKQFREDMQAYLSILQQQQKEKRKEAKELKKEYGHVCKCFEDGPEIFNDLSNNKVIKKCSSTKAKLTYVVTHIVGKTKHGYWKWETRPRCECVYGHSEMEMDEKTESLMVSLDDMEICENTKMTTEEQFEKVCSRAQSLMI